MSSKADKINFDSGKRFEISEGAKKELDRLIIKEDSISRAKLV